MAQIVDWGVLFGLLLDAAVSTVLLWRLGITPAGVWREIRRRIAGD